MISRPESPGLRRWSTWKGRLALGSAFFALCSAAWLPARGAPQPRFDGNLNGDFLIIGSTIGYDCGSEVGAPANSQIGCTGLLDDDTAADLFWLDGDGSPTAGGNAARTSAQLDLPADATVIRAQLYWAGLVGGSSGDDSVQIDRPNGSVTTVVADEVQELPGPGLLLASIAYQATADVTDVVRGLRGGAYRVTDIDARRLLTADDEVFGGWVLVVMFERPGAGLRRISLHDGLSAVAPDSDVAGRVPGLMSLRSPTDAALAVWGFEGDDAEGGDRILVEGVPPGGSVVNPATNFFNGSRSLMGVPVAGLVPEVSGAADTLAGIDIDVVDISENLSPNTGNLDVEAVTTADTFWLGGFVASLALVSPPPDAAPPPPPPPDAAPDASVGTPDAGAPEPDARVVDVGSGGGNLDVRAPDSLPAEAGVGRDGPVADGSDRSDQPGASLDGAMATSDAAGGSALPGGSVRTVLGGSGCACRAGGREVSARSAGVGLLISLWFALTARRRRVHKLGGGPVR